MTTWLSYMAFLVPFNEFDGSDQANKLGLNPDLLAKFPQGCLGEGLADLHLPAGQGEQPLARRLASCGQEDAPFAQDRDGGGKDGAGGIEAVVAHEECWSSATT
jgi:hypothetical protein